MTSNPQETNTLPVGVLEGMADAYEAERFAGGSMFSAMQAAWEASPGPALAEALQILVGSHFGEHMPRHDDWDKARAALSLLTPDENQ